MGNGWERSPIAAAGLVSSDASVQETQSGAQPSAFAYRDGTEGDRDRWAAPWCRVTTASDIVRHAKCTTWQRSNALQTSPSPRSQ